MFIHKFTRSFHCADEQCSAVISELQELGVPSMSPSEVCQTCYHGNNGAVWLSYLTCIRPNEHNNCDYVTVVVSDSQDDQQLVPVRPAHHLRRLNIGKIQMCRHNEGHCPKGGRCLFAHSDEELNHWRWERAREILDNEFPVVNCTIIFVILIKLIIFLMTFTV